MTEPVTVVPVPGEGIVVNVDPAAITVGTDVAGPPIELATAPAEAIVLTDTETGTVAVTVGTPPHIEVAVTEPGEPIVVTVPSTVVPGPPPTGGGGGGSWRHVQSSASATWTITHPLGYRPAVTVENTAGLVIEGDVAFPDTETVIIHFSIPVAGAANLS